MISSGLETAALYLSIPVHRVSGKIIRSVMTPVRPSKDGNYDSDFLERVRRVFWITLGIATAPLTISLALLGALLYWISDCVKGRPYSHFRGTASEIEEGKDRKLMTQNACMLWGGLPIPLGGMRPPEERIEALAQEIKKENPDVLVMQEVSFDPACSLYSYLKNHFAHFFTRIGPNPPLMESGLFIASKYKVLNQGFIPFPGQCGIYRGAFWIETPKGYYVTTHMEFGDTEEAKKKRKEQMNLILKKMQEFKKDKPCFFLGDLNLDRVNEKDYEEIGIPNYFEDPYKEKYPKASKESSTCTDVIVAKVLGEPKPKKQWELIDYALLKKGSFFFQLSVNVLPMYSNKRPDKALSDHKGLILTAAAVVQQK